MSVVVARRSMRCATSVSATTVEPATATMERGRATMRLTAVKSGTTTKGFIVRHRYPASEST